MLLKAYLLGITLCSIMVISVQQSSGVGEFDEISSWGSFGILVPGKFSYPQFIDTDSDGNIYVTDLGNKRIQKFLSNGQLVTTWGTHGKSTGQFHHPAGIAVHNDTVFVADRDLHRIQQFTTDGKFVMMWGERGSDDGEFLFPNDIDIYNGTIYVADTGNQRIQVFWLNGTYIKTIGSSGLTPGKFISVTSIDIDSRGNLYAADHGNKKIEKFTSDGQLIDTIDFGTDIYDFIPGTVLVDPNNMLLVANIADDRVLYIPQNSTYRLNSLEQRGPFTSSYDLATDITIGINGEILLVDSSSHKIRSFTTPYYVAPPSTNTILQNTTEHIPLFDKTKPMITVPDSIIVEATDKFSKVDLGIANATDSSGIRGITNTAPKLFAPGVTIVKWVAFDNAGYTSSDTQSVAVLVCGKTPHEYNIIEGTPNDDLLLGTEENDLIFGLGGDDIISGGQGDDCIFGGQGDDIISGNDGSDTIRGNDGSDIIQGQAGFDLIYHDASTDTIISDSFDQCYLDTDNTSIDCNN